MQTPPPTALLHGSEAAPPERRTLRAGPLTMRFEPESATLRTIRLGEREVLRGIYAAVRDRNWDTIRPRVSHLAEQISENAFRVTFDVECREGEIDFRWRGAIEGDAEGTIRFAFDGVAGSTFQRNRIGFCVLHPIRECAGQPCTLEKADGSVEPGVFPRFVSPHQPFENLRAIAHEVIPGVVAAVRMEGDTFETEDQRNWTDASYKTYCTPLGLPYPVTVPAGTRIAQSVTLTLTGQAPLPGGRPIWAESAEVVLSVGDAPPTPLPRIGLCAAGSDCSRSDRERERLRALHLAHLRVDLVLSKPGWREALTRAAREADAMGSALEAAVFVSDAAEAELAALLAETQRVGPKIARWLVFHENEKSTTERWARLARFFLPRFDPRAPIGAGTNAYFAELNREHPPINVLDLVCYSVNPQVHAFDDASLIETLEAQAETVRSARQFAAELPIAVTPITLRPRFNPNATGPAPPPQADPRQRSLLGAGWTLGSLKYLAESGAHSATYYETTGGRGVMEGVVFPLYHVLADIGEFAGGTVRRVRSSAPLLVEGMVLVKGGKTRLLAANLSPHPREVRVIGLPARLRVKRLDRTNAEAAMRAPEAFRAEKGEEMDTVDSALRLRLLPYALARIDAAEAGDA